MQSTLNIPPELFEINIEAFILNNSKTTPEQFVLNNKQYSNELKIWLADLLKVYCKDKNKLPTFFNNYCLFTSKSYEQSSSERTALYKAGLFTGNLLLDLSGGLGVDDWAFSKHFKQVISIDSNPQLNKIAEYNFKKLGCTNIKRISANAEHFIEESSILPDLIYLDADRRANKEKSVKLDDASPNILEILPICLKLSKKVLIKVSPLTDITYLKSCLVNLSNIWLVESKGELKEILCLIESESPNNTKIFLASASDNITEAFNAQRMNTTSENHFNYVAISGPSLNKLTNREQFMNTKGLYALNQSKTLFGSTNKIEKSPFYRLLKVVEVCHFGSTQMKEIMKKYKLKQVNIWAKDFVLKPEEIVKKYQITEGGNMQLLFTTIKNSKVIILGEPI